MNAEKSLVEKLDAISAPDGLTFEQRLQLTCCTIYEYRKRFLNDLAPQCNKHRAEIDEEIKSLIGEIVPLMCSKYQDNSKACSSLPKLTYPSETRAKSIPRTILAIVLLLNDKDQTR